jgi:hypothetical protein
MAKKNSREKGRIPQLHTRNVSKRRNAQKKLQANYFVFEKSIFKSDKVPN